jgi:hypothetical protein
MEIWKEIESPSLEFDYEVSNQGNVRSLNYRGTGKTQELKYRYTRLGARHVLLAGRKVRSVAQLVLLTFGEPRPSEKHFSHHKDGNIQNDCIENLEWQYIGIQNAINTINAFKFPKGHSYGLKGIKFQKGNTIGMAHRFKSKAEIERLIHEKGDSMTEADLKRITIGMAHRFKPKAEKERLANEKGEIVNPIDSNV